MVLNWRWWGSSLIETLTLSHGDGLSRKVATAEADLLSYFLALLFRCEFQVPGPPSFEVAEVVVGRIWVGVIGVGGVVDGWSGGRAPNPRKEACNGGWEVVQE